MTQRCYNSVFDDVLVDWWEFGKVPRGAHLVDAYSLPEDNAVGTCVFMADTTDEQHAALIALDGVSEHKT